MPCINSYASSLWICVHSDNEYNECERITVPMRDSIMELESLLENLTHDVGCVDPIRRDRVKRQMEDCLGRISMLTDTKLEGPIKAAVERCKKKMEVISEEYTRLLLTPP